MKRMADNQQLHVFVAIYVILVPFIYYLNPLFHQETIISITGIFIIFPATFINNTTETGLNQTFCHEMWHIYKNMDASSLKDINEKGDHSSMFTDPVYESWLKAIFPNKDKSYYEILKYSGAEDTPEYQKLSSEKKEAIKDWRNANGLGKQNKLL